MKYIKFKQPFIRFSPDVAGSGKNVPGHPHIVIGYTLKNNPNKRGKFSIDKFVSIGVTHSNKSVLASNGLRVPVITAHDNIVKSNFLDRAYLRDRSDYSLLNDRKYRQYYLSNENVVLCTDIADKTKTPLK